MNHARYILRALPDQSHYTLRDPDEFLQGFMIAVRGILHTHDFEHTERHNYPGSSASMFVWL
jgi:hypothetical protein